jgi:L-galactono-1,4-lactone dehydrogenase
MSPAYSTNPNQVFSWVGIIMYLPSELNDVDKEAIKQKFTQYKQLLQPLCDEYKAVPHWAKIEMISDNDKYNKHMLTLLQQKYDMDTFKSIREAVDPNCILLNRITEKILE